jgi:hypothetical protein
MNRLNIVLALLSVAAISQSATVSRTAGIITAIQLSDGHITVYDNAGHTEHFATSKTTKITRNGKPATLKSLVVGDRAARLMYDPTTKVVVSLIALSAVKRNVVKADEFSEKGRAIVTGEIANTDIIQNKISVRLGGGSTVDFKVSDATKIILETPGADTASIGFEKLTVGQRVEILSKDWKTADEIHVSGPRP